MAAAVQAYFRNIGNAVTSIFEGLAVTMSWMFREPSTIQYPHHPSAPDVSIGGPGTLPERYRGLLEVDTSICTACQLCEKACPIDCIVIDIDRVLLSDEPGAKPVRAMLRFDIDMAKCMYCGLCSEPCPTEAIRHTREFESTVVNLEHLVARFIQPGEAVVPFKAKKGEIPDTCEHGAIARSTLVEKQWDLGPMEFPEVERKMPHEQGGKKKKKK